MEDKKEEEEEKEEKEEKETEDSVGVRWEAWFLLDESPCLCWVVRRDGTEESTLGSREPLPCL